MRSAGALALAPDRFDTSSGSRISRSAAAFPTGWSPPVADLAIMQRPSPVTAAGPPRICTVFRFVEPKRSPDCVRAGARGSSLGGAAHDASDRRRLRRHLGQAGLGAQARHPGDDLAGGHAGLVKGVLGHPGFDRGAVVGPRQDDAAAARLAPSGEQEMAGTVVALEIGAVRGQVGVHLAQRHAVSEQDQVQHGKSPMVCCQGRSSSAPTLWPASSRRCASAACASGSTSPTVALRPSPRRASVACAPSR